jgi:DNA gyrase subunit B
VAFLRGSRQQVHDNIFYCEAEKPEAEVELAMQYDEGFSENTHTFVNNINTHEGARTSPGSRPRSPGRSTTTPGRTGSSRRPTRPLGR